MLHRADDEPVRRIPWHAPAGDHKAIEHMPAVRWKIQNLQKLKASNPRKFQQQAAALRESLEE